MKLKTLAIATFNLYNLNEPGLPLYGNKAGWSSEAHALKVDWSARVLRQLAADVFGFQELWHRQSLQRIFDAAGLAADYDLLLPPGADGLRIVCAAAVRKGLLVGTPEWIEAFPAAFKLQSGGDDAQTPDIDVAIGGFSRPVLHFEIQPRSDQPATHCYVCHFKSKMPTQVFKERWYKADKAAYAAHAVALGGALSTIRRTAEAAALRWLLTERMKGSDTPVMVLGDINDATYSNTANILTGQPRYLVGDSVGGGDTALYTAQTLREYRDTRDVYYTHVHQDIRESLDQILVSEQFYDNSRRRVWIFDDLAIYNDHLNSEDHQAEGSSDHGVVCARFKYKPAKAAG